MTTPTTRDLPEGLDPRAAPRAGCWVLAMPPLLALAVVGGYAALLLAGLVGNEPRGDRISLTLAGCEAAGPVLARRAEVIGLGDPVLDQLEGGPRLTATFPEGPDVGHIEDTLVRPGHFEIRAADTPEAIPLATGADVASATVRLDLSGTPKTAVELHRDAADRLEAHMEAHPEGSLLLVLDGETISTRGNRPVQREGKLDLTADGAERTEGIRRVAEWGVLLQSGPLPCPVRVVDREIAARQAAPSEGRARR